MNTEKHQIIVNGLPVQVVRKAIKNLHLGVYPPDGYVRVAAPLAVNDEAVRLAVIGKLGWIKRQQQQFDSQARQSQRSMVSGESHYFLGHRYRMRVIPHKGFPKIIIRDRSTMELYAHAETSREQREKILHAFYRKQLRQLALPLIEKWQSLIEVEISDWGIKKMKTKWGSCNIEARRIWLNLELAKKPLHCLEYVIVHEIVHLLVRNHNDEFISHMDKHLPQWRFYRNELNTFPLAAEKWEENIKAEKNQKI